MTRPAAANKVCYLLERQSSAVNGNQYQIKRAQKGLPPIRTANTYK